MAAKASRDTSVTGQIESLVADFDEAEAEAAKGSKRTPPDIAIQGTLLRNAYNRVEWCFEQLLDKYNIKVETENVGGQHQFHSDLLKALAGEGKYKTTPKEITSTLGKGLVTGPIEDMRLFRNQWKEWNKTAPADTKKVTKFDEKTMQRLNTAMGAMPFVISALKEAVAKTGIDKKK